MKSRQVTQQYRATKCGHETGFWRGWRRCSVSLERMLSITSGSCTTASDIQTRSFWSRTCGSAEAKPETIACARKFECAVCQSRRSPPRSAKSGPPLARAFNDRVQMGVFYIKADSGKVAVLHVVDVATTFGAGRVVMEEVGAVSTQALKDTDTTVRCAQNASVRRSQTVQPGGTQGVLEAARYPTRCGPKGSTLQAWSGREAPPSLQGSGGDVHGA